MQEFFKRRPKHSNSRMFSWKFKHFLSKNSRNSYLLCIVYLALYLIGSEGWKWWNRRNDSNGNLSWKVANEAIQNLVMPSRCTRLKENILHTMSPCFWVGDFSITIFSYTNLHSALVVGSVHCPVCSKFLTKRNYVVPVTVPQKGASSRNVSSLNDFLERLPWTHY